MVEAEFINGTVRVIDGYKTELLTNATTGLKYIAVYKSTPFYLNPFFVVALLVFIAFLILVGWYYFKINLRSRTNVVIHMPDKTRQFYSYKNYVGDIFKIKSSEKDGNGDPIYYNYQFKQECLERGYFGSYIEYDYGILPPINPKDRTDKFNVNDLKSLFKTVSAMLNSQLAVDLLLSSKWKDLMKTLLIITLVIVILILIMCGFIVYDVYFNKAIETCRLSADNQTMNVIRVALTSR